MTILPAGFESMDTSSYVNKIVNRVSARDAKANIDISRTEDQARVGEQ